MRAGKLRHRVAIQSPNPLQDPKTGEIVQNWAEYAVLWASIEPLSGREFIASHSVQGELTARITIRHHEGVSEVMRVVHQGDIYNIRAVLKDQKSGLEYMTLMVTKGANNG